MPQQGAASAGTLDEAMRALAEPRRRAILRLVAHDELAAGEIAAAFDVTRTAVSQHLTVLKDAGLLTERRDGTRRLYRVRPEGLAALREFLEEMWASSLDVGRRLVEADRHAQSGGKRPTPLQADPVMRVDRRRPPVRRGARRAVILPRSPADCSGSASSPLPELPERDDFRHHGRAPGPPRREDLDMSHPADTADGTVLPLRRPPIRQSTVVRSDRAHTFDVFVCHHRRLVAGTAVLRRWRTGPRRHLRAASRRAGSTRPGTTEPPSTGEPFSSGSRRTASP